MIILDNRPFIWRMMFDTIIRNFRENQQKVNLEELEEVLAQKEYQDILCEYDKKEDGFFKVVLNQGEFAVLFDTILKLKANGEEKGTTNKLVLKEFEYLEADFKKYFVKGE